MLGADDAIAVPADSPIVLGDVSPAPVPAPPTRTEPSVPDEPLVGADAGARLSIDAFNGVVPVSQALCTTSDPWAIGERSLESNERLGTNDCFALEAAVRAPAAFLVTRSGEGEWYRLLDSSCQSFPVGSVGAADDGARRLRFPDRGALAITGRGTAESFWLVAGAGAGATRAARIIDALPDGCSAQRGSVYSPLPALADAAAALPGALVWRRLDVARQP